MFAVALQQYRAALEERSVLDFSDVLQRAVELLRNMGEFSQSRYRLEYRYHHVLVDEFQDTSRAQWELISLLIQAWGEGLGLASQPSIFIVGDRKQSIYRFRDADVAVLREAAGYIDALRPGAASRRSISRSFRAVPALQAFVNDLFTELAQGQAGEGEPPSRRPDDFTFEEADRFPTDATPLETQPVLGLAVGESPDACAVAVAEEIRRILEEDTVRDRDTGVARRATPGDIAILFRSRTSHREFERELIARGIPTYVYKGLGFFDADEIKDLTAMLRFLANPTSDLRAAAFLRSRFVRLSDAGLAALAPRIAEALAQPSGSAVPATLDAPDARAIEQVRAFLPGWLARVDRVPPADLIEEILKDTAYAFEIRGPRRLQAWENIKKMRGLVRRMQNRGLRDADAARRARGRAERRRRVERGAGGSRRREPDDGSRLQGPRVSNRLRRQPRSGGHRAAATGARDRQRGRRERERRALRVGDGRRRSRRATSTRRGVCSMSR